jgi:hypothetical protein
MADQIPIPQQQVPQMQFQQPDLSGIAAIYNRPKPAEIGATILGQGLQGALEAYYKNKQLQAGAFEAGGPYLMNLLYGSGQQASTTPQGQMAGQQPPTQMPQAGDSNQNPPPPPTSAGSMGQGQTAGVNYPTNGAATPQSSAQTLQTPQQPQQDQQPSQAIQASINMGAPDFTGHLQRMQQLQGQMAGYQNMGKFGREQQQGVAAQMTGEKAALDAEQAPIQYAKAQQDLANSQQQIPMEQKKTIASEVSKQSQDSQQIRDLQVLTGNLQKSLGPDLGMAGNIKGDIFRATGGRKGSNAAANMQNSTIPLATGLNTVLSHRFNAGEVAALGNSLIPQPKDTPAYRQQKLQNLNNLLGVMAQGNEQNVRNVANAIMTGAIPSINPPGQSTQAPQQIHNAAMQWAQAHPNDPRAQAVMQKAQAALGGQ